MYSACQLVLLVAPQTLTDMKMQAEEPCKLDRAAAIMGSNARELAEGDRRSAAGGPPMWLNMLGNAVSAELRAPGEVAPARANNPVRCTIM